MRIPHFLLDLPRPWGTAGYVGEEEIQALEWNEVNAARALDLCAELCDLYGSGFPWLSEGTRLSQRQQIIDSGLVLLEPQPTYAELTRPHELAARIDMDGFEPIQDGELEPVIDRRVISDIKGTTKFVFNWLCLKGHSKKDWSRASELVELARRSIPNVYPWLQLELLGAVGSVLREDAFPFFDELLASPHASEMLKKDVHYIGSLIERRINVDAFEIDT